MGKRNPPPGLVGSRSPPGGASRSFTGKRWRRWARLTAGLAHEINNPVAFVLSNQTTLRRDFEDLLALVGSVKRLTPELARVSPETAAALSSRMAELDVEYLATAIPAKLSANVEGLERVAGIVSDLKGFSRLDEAALKEGDPAEGIAAGLRFLQPLLRSSGVKLKPTWNQAGCGAIWPR